MSRLKIPSRAVKSLMLILLAAFWISLVMANISSAERDEKESARGWLGVYVQDITEELKEAMDLKSEEGVLVRDVVEDSPADEAGIREEDVILVFDKKKVDDSDELIRVVREASPGDKVNLMIVREGKEKSVSVILGKVPKDKLHVLEYSPEHKKFKTYSYGFSAFSGVRIGVKVQDLNEQLGEYFGIKDGEGALITEVDEDGPAHEAGLKAGDVIVEVDGKKIEDVDELRDEISDKDEGENVEIKVIRDRQPKEFTVEVEEAEEWSLGHLKGLDNLKVLPPDVALPGFLWEEKKLREHEDEFSEELEGLKEELEKLKEELNDLRKELR
jgi:S1-C subfamily serine protease